MATLSYQKRDLYREVTSRILSELEAGAAPWVKPWSATPGLNHPHNAVSNRPYSGCNVVLLWMKGFSVPRYLTFKQAIELGGNVRRGEHGSKVYFVKQLQVQDKEQEGETRLIPMLKEYTVFNIEQCDGLPERILEPKAKAPRNKDSRDPLADQFLTTTQADIREGHGEAYYIPSKDFISLPAFSGFKNADNFYSTVFHELGHWTGSKARLDRDLKGRFGDRLTLPRSLLRSYVQRSSVPSLIWTASFAMPVTSAIGLNSSKQIAERSLRQPHEHKRQRTISVD
jgi:antirestriction protein ArdC